MNNKLKHVIFVFLVILAVSPVSCTSKKAAATDYSKRIVELQSSIVQGMLNMAFSFESRSSLEMTNKRRELINICKEVIRQARELKPFEGNSELRDTAVKLFEFYLSTSQNEYREIADILGRETTQEDMQRINKIVEDITIRESSIDNEFMTVKKAFVEKYGITIVDKPIQKIVDNL